MLTDFALLAIFLGVLCVALAAGELLRAFFVGISDDGGAS